MWNDLTTKERFDIYKSYKKSNPELSYIDISKDFNDWYSKISELKNLNPDPNDESHYYDYAKYYLDNINDANLMLNQDLDLHFPDTYKLPGHPTFSDESIYSNEDTKGGTWIIDNNGNWNFQHSDYTIDYSDRTNEYLKGTNEYATYKGGTVLPSITVKAYDDGGYISQNEGTITQGSDAIERFGRYVSNTIGNYGTNLPFDALRDIGMDIPITMLTPTGYYNMSVGKSLKENVGDLINNTKDAVVLDLILGSLATMTPLMQSMIKGIGNKTKFTLNRIGKGINNSIYRYKQPDIPKSSLPDYATPNYQGDHLLLTKLRLENGGFDKLGIDNDMLTIPINNTLTTINRRDALLNSQPTFDKKASYNPVTLSYTTKRGKNSDKAALHEFTHMADDFTHRYSVLQDGKGNYVDNYTDMMKYTDGILTDVPGFSGKQALRDEYFRYANATELNARGTQIKNYFGINDPNLNITPEMWNYAKKNYVKDTRFDNNMTDMFRDVNDVPKYLDWLNPRISSTLPIISTINNNE